jgi:hypothetical protein
MHIARYGRRSDFFRAETLSQGWRQLSYQLKTGTVPVFSQNKKTKNKNIG